MVRNMLSDIFLMSAALWNSSICSCVTLALIRLSFGTVTSTVYDRRDLLFLYRLFVIRSVIQRRYTGAENAYVK